MWCLCLRLSQISFIIPLISTAPAPPPSAVFVVMTVFLILFGISIARHKEEDGDTKTPPSAGLSAINYWMCVVGFLGILTCLPDFFMPLEDVLRGYGLAIEDGAISDWGKFFYVTIDVGQIILSALFVVFALGPKFPESMKFVLPKAALVYG